MATFPVKYYTSAMPGAPVLANGWGDLTNLLDAVLVDGFALKTIDTLTSAAGVATATISAGHGYQKDQVILIAGCDQAEYNGEQRVISATSTAFTFAVAGSPVTPATGASITAKVAPLGWERTFTGTNKRVFRSLNPQSNRPYLRVDNSLDPVWNTAYAKYAKVTMAEAMTNIDTFVAGAGRAPFDPAAPTKNEVGTGAGAGAINGWYKWYHARVSNGSNDTTDGGATARSWVAIGDDRGFYLFNDWQPGGGANGRCMSTFTDFLSFRLGDGYNTLLAATDSYVAANAQVAGGTPNGATGLNIASVPVGKVLMRSHLQIGANVNAQAVSLATNGPNALVSGNATGVRWPNDADYSLVLHPVYLQQSNDGSLRGKLPGVFFVHNNGAPGDLTVVDNVAAYPGRKFLLVACAYAAAGNVSYLAFDIAGPWW